MNNRESRWARIVFWDRMDIDALHHRENSLARRYDPLGPMAFVEKDLATWEEIGMLRSKDDCYGMNPYWPEHMLLSVRDSRMSDFQRRIYPIWKSIEEKDYAIDQKKPVGQGIPEVVTLHKQDLAIVASGFKPDRQSADAMSDRIKRGSAKMAQAMGQ